MEVLVALVIVAMLATFSFSMIQRATVSAKKSASTNNLRQLSLANISYAADNGTYCPAQDAKNIVRWHGSRKSTKEKFDPSKGFLSEYLGKNRTVGICPSFKDALRSSSWELGSGGYGYNATYVGGTPQNPFKPNSPANIYDPARTIMFATTALSKSSGVQEYPFAEPYRSVSPNWNLESSLQPSLHFRFHGKALVAWCDGHITAEQEPVKSPTNFYGGNNDRDHIGFIGPRNNNGFWTSASK